MATLSSSEEPAAVVGRAPSSMAREQSPISRSISPLPNAGDTPTIVAFRDARNSFRKSLSEKDLKRIMIPTGPEDVVDEIEKWRRRHLDSKVAASVRSGLGQLQRFSASIDMLAQGTPSPGCLLWGSIKFVLTVSSTLIWYTLYTSFRVEFQHLRINEPCLRVFPLDLLPLSIVWILKHRS